MRYEVIRSWHGVSVGEVIETDNLHEALKPNVRLIPEVAQAPALEVATPRRGRPPKEQFEE